MPDKAGRLQVPDVTVAVEHLERDRIASRAGKRLHHAASTASPLHRATRASHTESIAFQVFLVWTSTVGDSCSIVCSPVTGRSAGHWGAGGRGGVGGGRSRSG